MTFIRQISWTEQPPEGIDIDWANPITRGLVAIQTGNDITGWVNNGTTPIPTRVGMSRNFVSASSQYLSKPLVVTYPLTMFALHRQTSLEVNRALISVGNSSTGRHMLYLGTADQLLLFSGSGPGQWGSSSASVFYSDTSKYHMAVGVVRSSSNRQGYYDGVSPFAANTGVDTVAASNTVAVGAYWLSGAPQAGFYWPGEIALAGIFNRDLSDQEIKSLSDNPWQLFAPRRLWVPTLVTTGAYTLNAETGAYTFTGSDATLLHNYALTLESASYSLTGSNTTFLKGLILDAASGSYTLTGSDATFVYNKLLNASSGSYSVTGADANLIYTPGSGAYTLNAESGAYVLTGSDVTFAYSGGLITLKAGSWIRYRIIT